MLKGLACDTLPRQGKTALELWPNRCADLHSGLKNAFETSNATDLCDRYDVWLTDAPFPDTFLTDPPFPDTELHRGGICGNSPATDDGRKLDLKRELIRLMPLYELKAAIDALFLYINPVLDLTENQERIASSINPTFCVDADEGNVLSLAACDGSTFQRWRYDRESGLIGNLRFGIGGIPDAIQCLELTYGARASGQGFPVRITDCVGDEWQTWTYDPETQVLLSSMGTVLTFTPVIDFGLFRFGPIVWSAPLVAGGDTFRQQQWLAD
jgi:hypothetical protein